MIPWEEIERAGVPGGRGELIFLRRGDEYSIRTPETELMNSRRHGSEEALAELSVSRLGTAPETILVGGLGMGYTLAATLRHSAPETVITVSELVPAVVRWNRDHLGFLAGYPLEDPRVRVEEKDVGNLIAEERSAWDIILLDVDNGPSGLTRKKNDRLYGIPGLKQAFSALRPGGVLAVWSSGPDEAFTRRLEQVGFKTEIRNVRAQRPGKGSRHTLWFASRP